MLIILFLFLFTILYEGLIIAYTISVADRRKYLAAIFSAAIEPVKFISLLVVIDTPHKILGISAISLACAISNILIISLMNKMKPKKNSSSLEEDRPG